MLGLRSRGRPAAESGEALVGTIRTATVFSIVGNAAAACGGLVGARYLGPALKGDYAAAMAFFAVGLVLGELGQQAAIVYYVAHDGGRAADYVRTSRNIMLVTGSLVAVAGVLLAPLLADGRSNETLAIRILFLSSPIAFVDGSFTYALQAQNIRRWMVALVVQPITYLIFIVIGAASGWLDLISAALIVAGSLLAQAIVAAAFCQHEGLLHGRHDRVLGRRVIVYGTSQLLTTTPTTVNTNLDQLILSQTVPIAGLGQYALASSLTTIATPLVGPIGMVLFPRLAAGHESGSRSRLVQRRAVLVTVAVSGVVMLALAATAGTLVPLAFGHRFRPAVELIWIMAPAGVFVCVNRVAADLLRGRGRPLSAALAQGVGAVLTIAMLAILIPAFGVVGAAVTTSVTYGVTSVVMILALTRKDRPHPAVTPTEAGP
jgi:O-antigen/teichoic acid export membrane protein